ncbi:MAG: 4-(cytidine 5'-diphospho)-2-C-methyl-D-erythritol kinase [Terriglobales bacterium]|jgi:4-diphosphocytidyl-2-C-methyl-D-erythritol kinase
MTIAVRSFAKINLGLYIGARRADGFHDLRTVYQTIALHDVIRVSVVPSRRVEIVCQCDDPRVPLDSSNTCYRMAALVMEELGAEGKVTIEIEKRLPVQGGMGAASSNAVATMLALEKALTKLRASERPALKKSLSVAQRLRLAAQVGSDLPLFVLGGTVLGVDRGEEVYPLADLKATPMVVVTPEIGVSTPKAFAAWDALVERETVHGRWSANGLRPRRTQMCAEEAAVGTRYQLTPSASSDRMFSVGCALSAWLGSNPDTGAPAATLIKSGGRVGNLSDLVRAGIENDFERVVFSEFPELRDMKRALERAGARYASLSGSGSTLYGLFGSAGEAAKAAERLRKQRLKAVATRTLTRREYWNRSLVVGR